ncbi:tesmin [Phyllostomus discolor]|uniref:Tesmin n=1 Tax=Phyllostomus discolor TaxID=89673 RepID=A0A7E6E4F1_9CHIR|nr:tesmin [Phyllostomus discolor]
MEEGALLGGMSSPEEAMVPDLFGADGGFVSENMPLKAAAVVGAEEEEFHVLKDPYLSAAGPKGPLLHAFNPPLSGDCKTKVKAELLVEESEEEMLGEFPRLPDLDPLEDPVLPAAPPPQPYNVHFLSPMRTAHGSPAIVPLGAWAREGAAHAGVRVIPVEVKEGGGASEIPEEAALQNPLCPEARVFRSSQEAEGASGASHQDTGPVVLCQLRGGAPVLRLDGSGAAGLQALHWAPRGQDPGESPQADGPRPVTALVGRLLPVPAKLNLITQDGGSAHSGRGVAPVSCTGWVWDARGRSRDADFQPEPVPRRVPVKTAKSLRVCGDTGSRAGYPGLRWGLLGAGAVLLVLPGTRVPSPPQLGEAACASAANGPAFPAGPALGVPPKPAVAGCCDCLAAGDCGSRCSGCNCRNSLCLGTERLKAIKACTMDPHPAAASLPARATLPAGLRCDWRLPGLCDEHRLPVLPETRGQLCVWAAQGRPRGCPAGDTHTDPVETLGRSECRVHASCWQGRAHGLGESGRNSGGGDASTRALRSSGPFTARSPPTSDDNLRKQVPLCPGSDLESAAETWAEPGRREAWATVMCSSVCKCVGCRSYPESPERRAPAAVPACAETGGAEGGRPPCRAERRSSCISWEVVEATCACLLAQGEEAERAQRPEGLAQQMILEEFGRCLSQILHTEFKSKGLTME